MLLIDLDKPNTLFSQGDQVAGQVKYQPPYHASFTPPTQPVRIVIEVSGKATTKFQGRDGKIRNDQADLFHMPILDFYGSQNVWAFSFRFPSRSLPPYHSTVDVPQTIRAKDSRKVRDPLPPSFNETSVGRDAKVFQAVVQYTVKASVWIANNYGTLIRLEEQSMPLTYNPREYDGFGFICQKMSPDTHIRKEFVVKSPLLSPNENTKNHNHKLQDPRQREKPLHFDFEAYLVVSTRGHLGQSISCLLSVLPAPKTSTAKVPDFLLKRYKVRLVGTTEVFTSGARKDHTQKNQEVVFEEIKDNCDGALSAQRGYRAKPILRDVVPTFSTHNISRCYTLHAEMEIECAGKIFPVAIEREFFVQPEMKNWVPSKLGGEGGLSERLDVGDRSAYGADAPPPYGEKS